MSRDISKKKKRKKELRKKKKENYQDILVLVTIEKMTNNDK